MVFRIGEQLSANQGCDWLSAGAHYKATKLWVGQMCALPRVEDNVDTVGVTS